MFNNSVAVIKWLGQVYTLIKPSPFNLLIHSEHLFSCSLVYSLTSIITRPGLWSSRGKTPTLQRPSSQYNMGRTITTQSKYDGYITALLLWVWSLLRETEREPPLYWAPGQKKKGREPLLPLICGGGGVLWASGGSWFLWDPHRSCLGTDTNNCPAPAPVPRRLHRLLPLRTRRRPGWRMSPGNVSYVVYLSPQEDPSIN